MSLCINYYFFSPPSLHSSDFTRSRFGSAEGWFSDPWFGICRNDEIIFFRTSRERLGSDFWDKSQGTWGGFCRNCPQGTLKNSACLEPVALSPPKDSGWESGKICFIFLLLSMVYFYFSPCCLLLLLFILFEEL